MNDDYIAGFFDGEGSLQIRIRKDIRYKTGFQISPRADFTQKDKKVLEILQQNLKMGNIYFDSHDKTYQLHIYKIEDLKKFIDLIREKIIVKKDQMKIFLECVEIISSKKHLDSDGVEKIRNLWFAPETEANIP